MKRVLIVQPAFIGDAILASALIENISLQDEKLKISLLVRKGNESLYKDHPKLDKLFVWDKSKGKFSNLLKLTGAIRKEHFEYVINLHRFMTSGIITAFSGGKITAGYDKNPLSFLFTRKSEHTIGDGSHEVDRYLELTDFFCSRKTRKPVLYPSDNDYAAVSKYKGDPFVTMAPASVWFTKQLPVHKWIELTETIPDNYNIYLLGAPADHNLCEEITAGSSSGRIINLTGKLSLLQSAALMKDAQMNYVNDSAPLHLASAVNAPVTSFFCSTVPRFGFGPLSDNSTIIETTERLDCRPCGLHGKKACPMGHFKCGNDIIIPEFIRS